MNEGQSAPQKQETSTMSKLFDSLEMKGIPYPFLTCSLAAVTRSSASYLSQPFKQIQQIKNMSNHQSPGGFFAIANDIHKKKLSFLTGSNLNAEKAGLREFSRFFLFKHINPKLEKQLPVSWQSSDLIKQSISGTLIAASDVALYGPIDRLSNIQVTYEQRHGEQLSAWRAYQTLPNMKSLWQGSFFNMMKYNYGWISFVTQHNALMNFLHTHDYDKSAGSLAVIGCDATIAAVNAPIMNALDVMYNKTTSDRPLEVTRPLAVIKHIYRHEGMKSFFRGTAQGCMLSLFAVIGRGWTMQRIEQLDKEHDLMRQKNCP